MLHPVGELAPSVYWRRRLMLLAAVGVLIGLTAWVLRPSGSKPSGAPANAGHGSSSNAALATSSPPATASTAASASTAHAPTRTTGTPAGTASGTPAGTASGAPAPCAASQLTVAAVVAKPTYRVGDEPQLLLQVTNTGPGPCVQDLADSQVELRVYNGESRVWGSHDCEIQPGTAAHTLIAGQPVRVSITWSGLSSEPKCAGIRQRVGAGTYTLYAILSGNTGTAAQFLIS